MVIHWRRRSLAHDHIAFDTPRIRQETYAAGFTDIQAEALTETVRAAQGVDLSAFSTTGDLKELEGTLKRDILEAENRLIQWSVAIALGQAALIATLIKLL